MYRKCMILHILIMKKKKLEESSGLRSACGYNSIQSCTPAPRVAPALPPPLVNPY